MYASRPSEKRKKKNSEFRIHSFTLPYQYFAIIGNLKILRGLAMKKEKSDEFVVAMQKKKNDIDI